MICIKLIRLPGSLDSRGLLSAAQYPDEIPFVPMRLFLVSGSPKGTVRGGHAHQECHQLLIRTAGSIAVECDDSMSTQRITLKTTAEALYIPPLVWARQTYLTDGASLAVLASHEYDPFDYIDDRSEAAIRRSVADSS